MCNSKFAIVVTGDKNDREKVLGVLVECSANLVTGFRIYDRRIIFDFRYRGDASFVMKRMARSLSTKLEGSTKLNYQNAKAEIIKNV